LGCIVAAVAAAVVVVAGVALFVAFAVEGAV
jgi:hypothetical protein